MILIRLAILIILCLLLPLPAFGHYQHEKKHSDHQIKEKVTMDLSKRNHHGRHANQKGGEWKNIYSEVKHKSNQNHHNDHVKKVPLIKHRRSVNQEIPIERQFHEDGREYVVTTDYPLYRSYRDLFADTRRFQEEHESRIKKIERIRGDLMKRFESYSWQHSFKPEIWDNLYKEVEHSMDRMRQFHEEQRVKFFQQFPDNNYRKHGHKVRVDDSYDEDKNKKIVEQEYLERRNHNQFGFSTMTEKPLYGFSDGDNLGPQTFPSNAEDGTESYKPQSHNKQEVVSESSNKWKGHKHHHHHQTKTNFNFDFGSADTHKNHNHHSHCRHHPSLGHYGHQSRQNSEATYTLCSHTKIPPPTTSKPTYPKVTIKPFNHGEESTTKYPDDDKIINFDSNVPLWNNNHHITNYTGNYPNKELFIPIPIQHSSTTSLPPHNSSQSYAVYEKPEEVFREYHNSASHINNSTTNSPADNKSHHHIHINYSIEKFQSGKTNNSMDSPIYFPTEETKSDDKHGSIDPCKKGGSIQIPILNINLPCGDITFNGSNPDDYYKREFATSMTNVFHDYLEKEKDNKDKDDPLDIDIRVGRKRRDIKNTTEKRNFPKKIKKENSKKGDSVFGEIMDVPKDLSKNDSNEYFDLTMLSDYFLEAVDSLDEASLIEVLVALKDDYLSKSPSDQAVVDEVYNKLVSSLLEYKRSNGEWNERQRRDSPAKARAEAAAALELLAETDQHLESEQHDDPSVNEDYNEYNDPDQGLDSNEDPSFLELVSLADKHKLKSR